MENLIDNTYVQAFAPELDLSQYAATTISGMIAQASSQVISYCQVDGFFQTTVSTEKDRLHINSAGDLLISFRRRPVNQGDVTGLRLRTVNVNQSLQLQSGGDDIYFIARPNTYLVYPSNYMISFGRGLLPLRTANLFYEVDYTGGYVQTPTPGYKTLPDDIKEATLLFFRDIYARRFNPAGSDMLKQGSMEIMTRRNDAMSTFVIQARSILDRGGYKRIVP